MPAVEVPAQIHYAPRVVEQIQVQPGTNWDLSRSTEVTPISVLPDPEPVKAMPAAAPAAAGTPMASTPAGYRSSDGIPNSAPLYTLGFSSNSAALPKTRRVDLHRLPTERALVIVAYPQPGDADAVRVCKSRARVVAALLEASGHRIRDIKVLAVDAPLSNDALLHERSVEVFAVDAGA